MKVNVIRERVIKPKLIDMLGNTMARDIIRSAEFATVIARDERETLRVFVEKTCSDPRFIGMWGTVQAEKQKLEWLELLS